LSLYVVDANVVAKWFVPERLSEEATSLLDDGNELAAPDLIWSELGNVLWKKARTGQLTSGEAAHIIRTLDEFPVTVFPARLVLEGALEVALASGRSVYDSVYVALAVALQCRLMTADERLVNALAGGPLAAHVEWLGRPQA
jgi:predicted nucleic acid-binding protein